MCFYTQGVVTLRKYTVITDFIGLYLIAQLSVLVVMGFISWNVGRMIDYHLNEYLYFIVVGCIFVIGFIIFYFLVDKLLPKLFGESKEYKKILQSISNQLLLYVSIFNISLAFLLLLFQALNPESKVVEWVFSQLGAIIFYPYIYLQILSNRANKAMEQRVLFLENKYTDIGNTVEELKLSISSQATSRDETGSSIEEKDKSGEYRNLGESSLLELDKKKMNEQGSLFSVLLFLIICIVCKPCKNSRKR